MYTPTGSEAREWRRCSLVALAVLLFSVAGQVVVSAHEEHAAPPAEHVQEPAAESESA